MIQIDMDMPKSCAVCRFNSQCDNCECIPNFCAAMPMKDQEGDFHANIGYFNDGTREYDPEIGFTPEDHRQDWCPLREVKRGKLEMAGSVNRQAAIDAINALHEKPNAWLDLAVDAVMTLPPAAPQWTPTSEHLPKRDGFYLTTIKTDGEDKIPFPNGLVWSNQWNAATMRWGYADSKVIAWMPQPKPYEGDKE